MKEIRQADGLRERKKPVPQVTGWGLFDNKMELEKSKE